MYFGVFFISLYVKILEIIWVKKCFLLCKINHVKCIYFALPF